VSFFRVTFLIGYITLFFSFFVQNALAAKDLQGYITSRLTEHFTAKIPNADITIVINSINDQVNLRKCSNFDFSLPTELPKGGRISLRVTCTSPDYWATYAVGKINAYAPIAVAAKAISKGSVVRANDIRFVRQNLSLLSQGFYTQPEEIIGLSARRHIANNAPITPQMMLPADLINKGESIIIEAKKGALVVRTQGLALENGHQGQQIRVLNERSQKEIRARVVRRGVVSASE